VNRNLVKLLVVVLIGFAMVFLFSSLSAQTRPALQETNLTSGFLNPLNPADEIYSGLWIQDQIPYGWSDSLKKLVTDSTFGVELQLIGKTLGTYAHPIPGRVTSKFGPRRYRYHYGTDLNLNTGDTVVAAFSGKVRMAKYHYGYGYMVVIRHYNGLETVYGHLSKILVDTNQFVRAGDIIGRGGNTGRSYGSHLHFETRYMGLPINPELIIDFEEGKLLNDTLFLNRQHFAYLGRGGTPSGSTGSTGLASYHKVRKGESLSVIAQRHGTSVTRLCQLNNISRTTTLQIGQTLRIR
jgi:murein DD-endopeptidase MepM/ murein hydrolase activator NlpD